MKCPCCGCENLRGADACDNCAASLTGEDVPQAGSEVERSLMEDPVECLHPSKPLAVDRLTSLEDAIRTMRSHRIGCVLVCGEDGKLIGILTERDLLRKVAGQGLDLGRCIVGDYMSHAPERSKADHPLGYALQRMIISDIRYLPVVDSSDRPTGVVSSRDIIAYVVRTSASHRLSSGVSWIELNS